MNKKEFIDICSQKLKLVRTEADYSQEKMAAVLGISKKTLVEIEKGRSSLGWQGSVVLCTLFVESDIIRSSFGSAAGDLIMAFAFEGEEPHFSQTMGGMIWWRETDNCENYKIQQNVISKHYRILDEKNRRVCSSFDYDDIKKRLQEVGGQT